jgi:hypothetical protein
MKSIFIAIAALAVSVLASPVQNADQAPTTYNLQTKSYDESPTSSCYIYPNTNAVTIPPLETNSSVPKAAKLVFSKARKNLQAAQQRF